MSAGRVLRRLREPAVLVCLPIGVLLLVVGWLLPDWHLGLMLGLFLVVISLAHVFFGVYDRRGSRDG